MAVSKVKRSPSAAQPARLRPSPQFKAELFETFQQLNRGYGIALAALDRLQQKTRLIHNGLKRGRAIFPAACLLDCHKSD